MGVGMRITKEYGDQMVDGIFNLMHHLGIWGAPVFDVRIPVISYDINGMDVIYLNAPVSGVFIKDKAHGELISEGEHIGRIVNPLTEKLLSNIVSPAAGWLFTIREYPMVEEGSLMGRILKQEVYDRCRK
jgi:predicted deacylase